MKIILIIVSVTSLFFFALAFVAGATAKDGNISSGAFFLTAAGLLLLAAVLSIWEFRLLLLTSKLWGRSLKR